SAKFSHWPWEWIYHNRHYLSRKWDDRHRFFLDYFHHLSPNSGEGTPSPLGSPVIVTDPEPAALPLTASGDLPAEVDSAGASVPPLLPGTSPTSAVQGEDSSAAQGEISSSSACRILHVYERRQSAHKPSGSLLPLLPLDLDEDDQQPALSPSPEEEQQPAQPSHTLPFEVPLPPDLPCPDCPE
ncbi:hypothetical protein Dimus_012827, partial [Dionaea muscipula]